MAKKPLKENDEEVVENTEITDDADETEETPAEPVKSKAPKKPINIMDTSNAAEPPKRKQKDDVPAVDLTPVLKAIDDGFKSLNPEPKKAPKEPKKEENNDFLAPLGDW